jgi:hypothetical protein
MNTNRKAVAMDLVFGARDQFFLFARDVEDKQSLALTFIRGSFGTGGAWACVELRGSQDDVDQVVDRWSHATVGFARLPQAAA